LLSDAKKSKILVEIVRLLSTIVMLFTVLGRSGMALYEMKKYEE